MFLLTFLWLVLQRHLIKLESPPGVWCVCCWFWSHVKVQSVAVKSKTHVSQRLQKHPPPTPHTACQAAKVHPFTGLHGGLLHGYMTRARHGVRMIRNVRAYMRGNIVSIAYTGLSPLLLLLLCCCCCCCLLIEEAISAASHF